MASSIRDLSSFVACPCALLVYQELAQALVFELYPRPQTYLLPGAQGMLFDLDESTDRYRRHLQAHVRQQALCAPAWLPRWLPLWLRSWWGGPRFMDAYLEQHKTCGFLGNPFELEARRAEDPTLVLHDEDEPPPVDDLTPGPRPPSGKKGAP
jgi:hypothetical protein